ncbi:MAG: thiamine-phosphate kinase [Porticoccaceae bacterium]
MASEFSFISRYFKDLTGQQGVALGIGDDAALIDMTPGQQLVVATDTLVEGVHFPLSATAEQIATRALCVNLSDIAAMGAKPKWFTLALTIPRETVSSDWLKGFSRGLAAVAKEYDLALVGGDTTAGPLTISITLLAEVPVDEALLRSGAAIGDRIYVTGTLGDGAAALAAITDISGDKRISNRLLNRFYYPQPQVQVGIKLRGLASACIDISDGLLADLGHICQASNVCAELNSQQLPIHPEVVASDSQRSLDWALSGGDDYQLCFTLPQSHSHQVDQWIESAQLDATLVGHIVAANNHKQAILVDGNPVNTITGGYDHFSD